MNKNAYIAPEVELIEIKFEQSLLSNVSSASAGVSGNMSVWEEQEI